MDGGRNSASQPQRLDRYGPNGGRGSPGQSQAGSDAGNGTPAKLGNADIVGLHRVMALTRIRRRVGTLESVFAIDSLPAGPPLTTDEIESLAAQLAQGQMWTREESARVAGQCPIIQGELLITAHRGQVFVRRYPGVDLAWI
jgi:hypothetical protein